MFYVTKLQKISTHSKFFAEKSYFCNNILNENIYNNEENDSNGCGHVRGNVIYINVMNNMSVDCDCDGTPAKPELQDMGIMASLDPVALDQACLDKVMNYKGKPGDDNKPLIQRINRQHGAYITDYAERIGLGSKTYTLINID